MLEYNEFYLYLIRHGQSEVNAQADLVGQKEDSQLTDKGRRQAILLGQRLAKEGERLNIVWTSPYDRARDTCHIAMNQIPNDLRGTTLYDSNLREYSAGDWTHAKRHEVHSVPVLLRMAAMTNGFCPPNGESMHMVERRASKWLEDNILYNKQVMELSAHNAAEGKKLRICAFSHGMTIKCLLHYVMGFDQSFLWKLTLENTSISKLYFNSNEEGWRLLTINDHAHLL
jgi:broad specificity phosphatase PhoE